MKHAKLASIISLFLALAMAESIQAAVLPNDAVVDGKTMGDWSAEWWQWLFSVPASRNPGLDLDGSFAHENQPDGSVFFLAGVFGFSDHAVRTIRVPEGKHFFFPLMNVFAGVDPTDPPTIEERLALAQFYVDTVTNLYAIIDGVEVPNLWSYRTFSPTFTVDYTDPDNLTSFFNGRPIIGTFNDNVADGYYLMVSPLAPGEHVIHLGGSMSIGFSLDVIYYITVAPIPLSERVENLLEQLAAAGLDHARMKALDASLRAARAAFEKGHVEAGVRLLAAFQQLVRVKVASRNPSLAADLTRMTQEIVERARTETGRSQQ